MYISTALFEESNFSDPVRLYWLDDHLKSVHDNIMSTTWWICHERFMLWNGEYFMSTTWYPENIIPFMLSIGQNLSLSVFHHVEPCRGMSPCPGPETPPKAASKATKADRWNPSKLQRWWWVVSNTGNPWTHWHPDGGFSVATFD